MTSCSDCGKVISPHASRCCRCAAKKVWREGRHAFCQPGSGSLPSRVRQLTQVEAVWVGALIDYHHNGVHGTRDNRYSATSGWGRVRLLSAPWRADKGSMAMDALSPARGSRPAATDTSIPYQQANFGQRSWLGRRRQMIRAIGSFLRSLLPNDLGTALGRFFRVIAGAALAAGIAAAINAVGSLPISTPGVVTFIGAALVALDKYLRNKGIY